MDGPHGPRQAPLYMGFSKQEYWSGLPCLSPTMILEGAVTIEGELSLYRGEYDNRRGVLL